MAAEGRPAQLGRPVLGVSESGYYAWLIRARSARAIRLGWLTEVTHEVHLASRETYGSRGVHAKVTLGHGILVGHQAVELPMQRAGLQGISGRPKFSSRFSSRSPREQSGRPPVPPYRAGPAMGHRYRAPFSSTSDPEGSG